MPPPLPPPPYAPLPAATAAVVEFYVRTVFNVSGVIEDWDLSKRQTTIIALAGAANITVDWDNPPTLTITPGSVQVKFEAPVATPAQAEVAAFTLGEALASPSQATSTLAAASLFVESTPVVDRPVVRSVLPLPSPPMPAPLAPPPRAVDSGPMDRDTGIALGVVLMGVGAVAAIAACIFLWLFRKRVIARLSTSRPGPDEVKVTQTSNQVL